MLWCGSIEPWSSPSKLQLKSAIEVRSSSTWLLAFGLWSNGLPKLSLKGEVATSHDILIEEEPELLVLCSRMQCYREARGKCIAARTKVRRSVRSCCLTAVSLSAFAIAPGLRHAPCNALRASIRCARYASLTPADLEAKRSGSCSTWSPCSMRLVLQCESRRLDLRKAACANTRSRMRHAAVRMPKHGIWPVETCKSSVGGPACLNQAYQQGLLGTSIAASRLRHSQVGSACGDCSSCSS